MKVGILAGGFGSRLSEETELKPKPMVEIGELPILWHIMKHYSTFGFDEFVIALGYRGNYIKRWFVDVASIGSDLFVDTGSGDVTSLQRAPRENWKVELIETGRRTNTGGRIKRLVPYLGPDTFMLTWGDGVSDVDLDELLAFHHSHGRIATLTAVRPPARFGHLELNGGQVTEFSEKPQAGEGWINGAFFVLEAAVEDYIEGDDTLFEREPLERLAKNGELMAYRHEGFWHCMDTYRDKVHLDQMWNQGNAPWKIW